MASHGVSRHLKRLAAPKSVHVHPKEHAWVIRTRPGPHAKDASVPIGIVLRDYLGLSHSARESKRILHNGEVYVDGAVVRDLKRAVGLMDVITIPRVFKYYRIMPDHLGRFKAKECAVDETKKKLCKIKGKSVQGKGVVQLNLHDGRNILVEKDNYKVGDTVMLSVPDGKLVDHIPLKSNAACMVMKGKHIGVLGRIVEIINGKGLHPDLVMVESDGKQFQTLKDYVFITGKESPVFSF